MKCITVSFITIFMIHASFAQSQKLTSIQWDIVAELPAMDSQKKALGFAGAVVGVTQDRLIIAGGANFPDTMPWLGGKKKYYRDVYVFGKNDMNNLSWTGTKPTLLKRGLAYCGNVTIPGGILCVGGETAAGHTDEVFLLKWDTVKNNIITEALPGLPAKLANSGVASIGNTIFVAGGEDGFSASNAFFELNLSDSFPGWKSLPPLPVALSHAVAISQFNGVNNCVYVIGGRTKTASGLSDLHNTVFCYDPSNRKWKEMSKIKDENGTTDISAATGVVWGKSTILLIGGDKGNLFHEIETMNLRIASAKQPEKQQLENQKARLLENHPGFSKDVLAYNTLTDSWVKTGELPGLTPVTTTAILWNDDIIIPSGELKPGRRTPGIWRGKIIRKNE
jgi:cyclically-permuted mutarotase family protein